MPVLFLAQDGGTALLYLQGPMPSSGFVGGVMRPDEGIGPYGELDLCHCPPENRYSTVFFL